MGAGGRHDDTGGRVRSLQQHLAQMLLTSYLTMVFGKDGRGQFYVFSVPRRRAVADRKVGESRTLERFAGTGRCDETDDVGFAIPGQTFYRVGRMSRREKRTVRQIAARQTWNFGGAEKSGDRKAVGRIAGEEVRERERNGRKGGLSVRRAKVRGYGERMMAAGSEPGERAGVGGGVGGREVGSGHGKAKGYEGAV